MDHDSKLRVSGEMRMIMSSTPETRERNSGHYTTAKKNSCGGDSGHEYEVQTELVWTCRMNGLAFVTS